MKPASLRDGPSRRGTQSGGPESAGEPVLIELSRAQVERVVRAASDGGSMTVLLSGIDDVGQALGGALEMLEDPRLSRSLLLGLMVLASFPEDGSELPVTHAAKTLKMNASTTHRYFQTLLAVGLLERDSRTRRYRRAL